MHMDSLGAGYGLVGLLYTLMKATQVIPEIAQDDQLMFLIQEGVDYVVE